MEKRPKVLEGSGMCKVNEENDLNESVGKMYYVKIMKQKE